MWHRLLRAVAGALVIGALLLGAGPGRAQGSGAEAAEEAAGDALLGVLAEPFAGDWPEIRDRRLLRVLTTYSRTNFLVEDGAGHGLEFELMTWLEQHLNRRDAPGGPADIRVVFVPLPFAELIPALLAGRGDVIAAGMTVTGARAAQVAFALPFIEDVAEVVVRHAAAPPVATPGDLSGRGLLLTRSSSYVESARALDARLRDAGRPGLRIAEAPARLETEDILEMVNAGIVPYSVADRHLAEAWARLLPNLVVEQAALASGGRIAWAVRPEATELKALLDAFVADHVARDAGRRATIFRRYFRSTAFLHNPLDFANRDRIGRFRPVLERESAQAGFNWLVILAQAFQESRLDHLARSPVGAVGLMQLMPDTGAAFGARDLTDATQNIRAGIAYMNRLRSHYFAEAGLDEAERIHLALVAYNAGPNCINRLRAQAAREGLDPNRWFGHVERVLQRRAGSETVRYVANIHAYFLTYAGLAEAVAERQEEVEALRDLLARDGPAGQPGDPVPASGPGGPAAFGAAHTAGVID